MRRNMDISVPTKGAVTAQLCLQPNEIFAIFCFCVTPITLQGQVRSQENKFAGAIWDCLPVTEKEKDSIVFAALCPEVRLYNLDSSISHIR